jgi:hypothetical protein
MGHYLTMNKNEVVVLTARQTREKWREKKTCTLLVYAMVSAFGSWLYILFTFLIYGAIHSTPGLHLVIEFTVEELVGSNLFTTVIGWTAYDSLSHYAQDWSQNSAPPTTDLYLHPHPILVKWT